MRNFFHSLVVGEEGATMVEYALMVALIAAVVAGVVTTLGTTISGKFTSINSTVSNAGGTTP